jgi:hypothetical protein
MSGEATGTTGIWSRARERRRCPVGLGRAPEAVTPLAAAREILARLGPQSALVETGEWPARVTTA